MKMDRTADRSADSLSGADGVLDTDAAQPDGFANGLDAVLFDGLFDAALYGARADCCRLAAEAVKNGHDRAEIADCYIPALARKMGDMWCEDTLAFAEVTIGVSRIQAMLRDLGPEWQADRAAIAYAPTVLVATPHDAHHTLGAALLAGQLRRRGISVRLLMSATADDFGQLIASANYNAVFLSASRGESLEKIRKMLESSRNRSAMHPPVLVGGSILEGQDNVANLVGAETATSNIDEALKFCGLKRNYKMGASRAPGR